MAIDVVRSISGKELEAWRSQLGKGVRRVVGRPHHTPGLAPADSEGNTAFVERPAPPPKRDARAVRDAIVERRIEGYRRLAAKDPAWFEQFVAYYRQSHPELASLLSDEDIKRITTEGAMRRIVEHTTEQSVQRVFTKQGRNGAVI